MAVQRIVRDCTTITTTYPAIAGGPPLQPAKVGNGQAPHLVCHGVGLLPNLPLGWLDQQGQRGSLDVQMKLPPKLPPQALMVLQFLKEPLFRMTRLLPQVVRPAVVT